MRLVTGTGKKRHGRHERQRPGRLQRPDMSDMSDMSYNLFLYYYIYCSLKKTKQVIRAKGDSKPSGSIARYTASLKTLIKNELTNLYKFNFEVHY